MFRRAFMTSLLLAVAAVPGYAQGKKSGGTDNDGMARLVGIDGSYAAYGRNPDGSEYSGRAEIVQQGDAVEISWTIGNEGYRGAGTIEGRIVTVDFGDQHPIVYVVMENGALHGTWADGRALDRLTPQ